MYVGAAVLHLPSLFQYLADFRAFMRQHFSRLLKTLNVFLVKLCRSAFKIYKPLKLLCIKKCIQIIQIICKIRLKFLFYHKRSLCSRFQTNLLIPYFCCKVLHFRYIFSQEHRKLPYLVFSTRLTFLFFLGFIQNYC